LYWCKEPPYAMNRTYGGVRGLPGNPAPYSIVYGQLEGDIDLLKNCDRVLCLIKRLFELDFLAGEL
ncbi:hypothetical protein P4N68_04465, partial [Corynebacterium felinum]